MIQSHDILICPPGREGVYAEPLLNTVHLFDRVNSESSIAKKCNVYIQKAFQNALPLLW